MKMSEVFNLPLSPAGLFARLSEVGCKHKNKHIAYAINNHDRLEQEVAELREAFKVVKSIAMQERNWRLEDCEEISASEMRESLEMFGSIIDKLLNK